jgi:hypothetical protein
LSLLKNPQITQIFPSGNQRQFANVMAQLLKVDFPEKFVGFRF